jgi:hypothetical protein
MLGEVKLGLVRLGMLNIHLFALDVVIGFVATLGVGMLESCVDPEAHICYIHNLLYASWRSESVARIVSHDFQRLLLASFTFRIRRRFSSFMSSDILGLTCAK